MFVYVLEYMDWIVQGAGSAGSAKGVLLSLVSESGEGVGLDLLGVDMANSGNLGLLILLSCSSILWLYHSMPCLLDCLGPS